MRYLATHELPDEQAEFAYEDLDPGQTFPPYPFTLTPADVEQYVAATGYDAPIYRDAAAALAAGLPGLVAPPTIVGIVGLLKAALGRRWPDSTLHLRQTFDFFDYPPVDAPLALHVSVGPKEERKGRRYLTLIGETRGPDGRVLVRAHSQLIYAWRAPATDQSATSRPASLPPAASAPGEDLPPLARTITQQDITRYALASGGRARIHTDPAYARSVGLPSTIAHGLMVMTYPDQMLERALGLAWRRGGRLETTFLASLRPGDTVTAHARRLAAEGHQQAFEVWCTNQHGERIHVGRATLQP
jgi:acyl dehydratase